MDVETLKSFFLWCTILNGALLILWAIFLIFLPNLVYRIHSKMFPMPRETFNVVWYCFLGGFEILYFIFVLIPFIALLICC